MMIVADSGSTKTDWALYKDGKVETTLKSRGHNPNVCAAEIITTEINTCFKAIDTQRIQVVHFYSAGLSNEKAKNTISSILKKVFKNAQVHCYHDILGAARASSGNKAGISCIMGTGSNTCVYDGEKITRNILSSGWILGDEGGGVNIGKRLLTSYLRNELSSIETQFVEKRINGSASQMIKELYEADRTNEYLASFAPIVVNNINQPTFSKIAEESIRDFFTYYILCYPEHKTLPIHFIGSIAYYLQDIVKKIGESYSVDIQSFNRKPLEKLVQYHSS